MKLENLFSKIKNSNKRFVDVNDTRITRGVLDILYREGIIRFYHSHNLHTLRVFLKSHPSNINVIKRRPFAHCDKLIPHHIMTTSQLAICTGKEARRAKIGGTILAKLT